MVNLIIYPGALGDVLLTRPVLFSIKQKFPNCHLDYVGNPEYLQLFHSEINNIYDFHSSKLLGLFSQRPELGLECRAWLETYDIIIFWSTFKDKLIQTKLASLKNTKFIYQTIKPPAVYAKHQTVFSLKSLKPLGISPNNNLNEALPGIPFSQTAKQENTICIHPGSGSRAKNLPLEIYKQVGKEIQEKTGFTTIFILGPAEKSFLNELQKEKLQFVTPGNVLRLKEILGRSKYYIGNDSGVTHLAAQMGIPTLAIFISTNPVVWGPVGEKVYIIHNQERLKNRFHFMPKLTFKNISTYFLEYIFKP